MEQLWLTLVKSGFAPIIISVLVALVATTIVFLVMRAHKPAPGSKQAMADYPERVKELSSELARASSDVEHVLEELAIVSRSRTEALANLEQRVKELAQNEKELQTRMQTLKSISLPAAEYFLEASGKPKARNLWRDYILFGLGALASAAIALAIKLIFNF